MSVRALIASLTLVGFLAGTALAQTPPPSSGRPFGDRPGSNHGGPFTPGEGGNPAGPYTPGTTPGGGGNGPFTPGAEGNPRGPYTPGTIDAPTGGGPFSGNRGGFWGSVKRIGSRVWEGITAVGNFLWTLGGWAPWAHMPARGTIGHGNVGLNVGRNENTNPPVNDGTTPADGGTGSVASGATTGRPIRNDGAPRPRAVFVTP